MDPLVGPGPALVAGLVLFFVPGLLLLAWLRPEDREALAFDEALFVLVAVSVAFSAWMALLLAEAGRFSLVAGAAVVGTLGVLAAAAALFRGRLHRPLPRWSGLRALLPALAVFAVSLALHTRPSEYLLGGRDPGTYVAAMALVGRTGGIAYVDPVVRSIPPEDRALFYRNPDNVDYSWGRFMGMPLENPRTGRVVPEHFHLFPAFGAYLFQSMGVKGALATPCVFGVLGTLAFFFAWRRLFGGAVALLGGLLLAINVVQVWFARYPMSETMAQFLIFFGLFAFALWEERASALWGTLAGAVLGLSLLVRIDSVLIAAALGLYVLVRRARGDLPWPRVRVVLVPFLLLSLHALVHAAVWARKYLLEIANRPYWQQPAWVWLACTVTALAVLLLVHRLQPRVMAWARTHGPGLRRAVIAGIVAVALYAAFLRPHLSAWAGGDGNDLSRMRSNFARLDLDGDGRIERAEYARRTVGGRPFERWDEDRDGRLTRGEWKGDPPWILGLLGFHRLAAHDAQSFVRLGWFVTNTVLMLGVAGLVLLVREWKQRFLFPVLVASTFAGFFFYKIRVYNDYFFALRRFLPVVIPVLLGLAALALVRLWHRGGWRRLAALALGAAMVHSFVRDTVPLVRYRDWENAVRFVHDVSRRFGPRDVVIFEQEKSVHLLSLPLWAVHGVNGLQLARFNPDPARLAHLVAAWRGHYRNIYFVHTYNTDLCGVFLERVEDLSFGTYEWHRAYGEKPRGPEARALHFRISRVVPPEQLNVPPLREIDIGSSDDVQISGFFDKEGGGDHTYRWTGRCASVYLPGARGGDSVVVTAASGERPGPPMPVQVSLGGQVLGSFVPAERWSDHALTLPDPLPAGPPVLRLDVRPWRPVNVLPGATDARDLGVMVDRIRLSPGPGKMPVSPTTGGSP